MLMQNRRRSSVGHHWESRRLLGACHICPQSRTLDEGSQLDEKLGLAKRKSILLGQKMSSVESAFVSTESESAMKTRQDLPSSDFATTGPDLDFASNSATTTEQTRAFGIAVFLLCPLRMGPEETLQMF